MEPPVAARKANPRLSMAVPDERAKPFAVLINIIAKKNLFSGHWSFAQTSNKLLCRTVWPRCSRVTGPYYYVGGQD